jgi:VIT1/CCC1 family predicted Fe2+/Mn2+ transporter
MQIMLGWQHDEANPNLMFHTGVVEYKDNPKVVPRAVEARVQLEALAHTFSRSVVFQGGWYLLLSLVFLAVAAWRKQALMAVLAGSGLFYVLPLLVLAPSSDFRYLSWMLQASVLATLAAFITPASSRRDKLPQTGRHLRTG